MAKIQEQGSVSSTDSDESARGSEIGLLDEAAMQNENAACDVKRSPMPWIGAIPYSPYGVMAVVNEEGYLVPLWTAGDLLRACKMIWRVTEG